MSSVSYPSTHLTVALLVRYVKREWQLLENQIKHDAEEREKTQKEAAASQPDDGKKSKVDNASDSEEELAKMEQAGDLCQIESDRGSGRTSNSVPFQLQLCYRVGFKFWFLATCTQLQCQIIVSI